MWAPYCLRAYRSGRLDGIGWCWDRAYAYEQFGFLIRMKGITAVRLIEMSTGEILAAWETELVGTLTQNWGAGGCPPIGDSRGGVPVP